MKQESWLKQLGQYVDFASAGSKAWIVWAVLGSLFLALLDTAGVAAMVPLMSVVTGADTNAGVLGLVSSLIGTDDLGAVTIAVAGVVAIAFIVKSLCAIPFRWWIVGRTARISADAASGLLRQYVLSPFALHRRRNLPEIYRNVGDATAQASRVLLSLVSMVSDLLVTVAILLVLLVTSPIVTLITVVFFGGVMGLMQLFMRRHQIRVGDEMAQANLHGWRFLMPVLDGFREARLTSSANQYVDGYRGSRYEIARSQQKLTMLSELPRYILEIVFVVAIMGIAAFLFLVGEPETAVTTLGLFTVASVRLLPTLNRISASFAGIRSGQAGLKITVAAITDLRGTQMHDETVRSSQGFSGDIEFDQVSFAYECDIPNTVEELSAVVREKQTTAIVGTSGAGKSTVLDLLLGLLQPTSGMITCGGRSIGEDPAAWFREVGVVPQDVFLLNSTLRENVAFGIPLEQINDDRVREVLALAELTEVVAALPDGLTTMLGERGVRLSGGQRQRIGLARALYRDPQILVLDEATSALDNETEREISQTLKRISGDMTMVIVAHRLSTVRDASQLLFIDRGRLAGAGTFEEVREQVPEFDYLVRLGDLT